MIRFAALAIGAVVGGCAAVSTIPLSQNSFQITTKASPECSAEQTQKIAFKRAAAETIKKGYDTFQISGSEFRPQQTVNLWNGSMSTLANQALTVTMYKTGDPAGSNALSAREILGPKWQEELGETSFNCYDV